MTNVYLIGVFDMFHLGHYNLLKKASELGNLYVGVVADKAVKRVKGENRPIYDQQARLNIIKELKCVCYADLISDFEITEEAIETFDLIVVGEDQSHVKGIDLIPKDKLYKMPRTEGISTSDIIRRIKGE